MATKQKIAPKKVDVTALLDKLTDEMQACRTEWNKGGSHDYHFLESKLLFEDMLIVCFSREYCVGTDDKCYSAVYIFRESKEPEKIYYAKFSQAHPKWNDPKRFWKTIKSATRKGDKVELIFETDGGTTEKFICQRKAKSK